MKYILFLLLSLFTFPLHATHYMAPKADVAPIIDGNATESCWNLATWSPIDQLWLGQTVSSSDFKGRYKAVWTTEKLYLLVEITDDVLSDYYSDPLSHWWDDDCVEVFLDENHSGQNHQYNYNAFAYHVSTLYDVVDLGTDQNPHLYNDHIRTKIVKNGNVYTWEMEITIYTDSFVYNASNNPMASLVKGKIMGFSIAYCDNDGGPTRQSFIGSEVLSDVNKDRSYIDASIFGTMELTDSPLSLNPVISNEEVVYIASDPLSHKLIITLKDNGKPDKIEVFNLMGEVVQFYEAVATSYCFDTSGLNRGIYLVRIKKDACVTVRKIIL